jgi:hypothetical protein
MVNPYFIEMQMRLRQEEVARMLQDAHVRSALAPPRPRLRLRAGSAIVRFGLFLNGNAYRCPDAPRHREGARTRA